MTTAPATACLSPPSAGGEAGDHEAREALLSLTAGKTAWARSTPESRIALLRRIRDLAMAEAGAWADIASRAKQIPEGSPLAGEEWLAGPYAIITACDALIRSLSQIGDKAFLKKLPKRRLVTGQLELTVMPHGLLERLMLPGVRAAVWMEPGITPETLQAGLAYDLPPAQRQGHLSLVLGAGNVAAISPLDAFHKLFVENQVVLLKLNPVNEVLAPVLNRVLAPLIEADALRVIRGDGALGAALTTDPLVESIHITGAGATHDRILWGEGEAALQRRRENHPLNPRPISSELGAVSPTIVLPGPWSKADIRFQAEQIATQKLQNSGYNCIALQCLILPKGWEHSAALLREIRKVMTRAGQRPGYYPGSAARQNEFGEHSAPQLIRRGPGVPDCLIADLDDPQSDVAWLNRTEIFAPAFTVKHLPAPSPAAYFDEAIRYANDQLYGTLGANIVIHPKALRALTPRGFEAALARLRYGTIAINCWSALGFLLPACPWGGFPGATLAEPGSGIGKVHNSFMLEGTERTVISAPFAPFPRGLFQGSPSLLPRPPWFITHRRQHKVAPLLTRFAHRPGLRLLPRLLRELLRG